MVAELQLTVGGLAGMSPMHSSLSNRNLRHEGVRCSNNGGSRGKGGKLVSLHISDHMTLGIELRN